MLAPYWLQHSRFMDALLALDALTAAELPADLALRVRLLTGTFASYINRPDTIDLLDSALAELPHTVIPDRLVVNSWCCLGSVPRHHHAEEDVRRCMVAATDAAAASHDPVLVALARDFAGYAASYLGDTEKAIELTLEAIADARRQGDLHALALLLATAVEALLEADRVAEAHALADEAFDLSRQVELGVAVGWVLLIFGITQIALERPTIAQGSLVEHLRFVTDRHPDPLVIGDSLAALAAALSMLGDDVLAARAWGASATLRTDQDVDPDRRRHRVVQQRWDAARERMGAERFDALVLGGSVAVDQILAELATTRQTRPRHPRTSVVPGSSEGAVASTAPSLPEPQVKQKPL